MGKPIKVGSTATRQLFEPTSFTCRQNAEDIGYVLSYHRIANRNMGLDAPWAPSLCSHIIGVHPRDHHPDRQVSFQKPAEQRDRLYRGIPSGTGQTDRVLGIWTVTAL